MPVSVQESNTDKFVTGVTDFVGSLDRQDVSEKKFDNSAEQKHISQITDAVAEDASLAKALHDKWDRAYADGAANNILGKNWKKYSKTENTKALRKVIKAWDKGKAGAVKQYWDLISTVYDDYSTHIKSLEAELTAQAEQAAQISEEEEEDKGELSEPDLTLTKSQYPTLTRNSVQYRPNAPDRNILDQSRIPTASLNYMQGTGVSQVQTGEPRATTPELQIYADDEQKTADDQKAAEPDMAQLAHLENQTDPSVNQLRPDSTFFGTAGNLLRRGASSVTGFLGWSPSRKSSPPRRQTRGPTTPPTPSTPTQPPPRQTPRQVVSAGRRGHRGRGGRPSAPHLTTPTRGRRNTVTARPVGFMGSLGARVGGIPLPRNPMQRAAPHRSGGHRRARTVAPLLPHTPAPVRAARYTPHLPVQISIPFTSENRPHISHQERLRAFASLARADGSNLRPSKTQSIGDFAVVEQTGKRMRIEVQEDIPARSLLRLMNLILLHAKHDKSAKLNLVQGEREKTFGQISKLTKRRLRKILETGGIFVVVGELDPVGGALDIDHEYSPLTSKFFNQSAVASLMMNRFIV
jgi:hypothetical protein